MVIVVSILFLLFVNQVDASHTFTTESQTVSCSGSGTCSAQCNANWSVSDNNSSYIDQAWYGPNVTWDDIGQMGETHTGLFFWLNRTDKSGCEPSGTCGTSNCAGSRTISACTFFTRNVENSNCGSTISGVGTNITLNFWVKGVELFAMAEDTPTGISASAPFGYARVFCDSVQKHDGNGACVNIDGDINAIVTDNTDPGSADIAWSSNALPITSGSNSGQTTVVYLIKDSVDTGQRRSATSSGGSGTFSSLVAGNYQVCLNGGDGFGTEVNITPDACAPFTVNPPATPALSAKWTDTGTDTQNKTVTPGQSYTIPFNYWNSGQSGSEVTNITCTPTLPLPAGTTIAPGDLVCPSVTLTAP